MMMEDDIRPTEDDFPIGAAVYMPGQPNRRRRGTIIGHKSGPDRVVVAVHASFSTLWLPPDEVEVLEQPNAITATR